MAQYVVYRGRVPGVYVTWAKCNAQVTSFKNNSYKSFPNKEEAEASYLGPVRWSETWLKNTVPADLL